MEEDESSMRKAAHLMVSSLAGSLALVTCREPLRSSLATQLRHLLANSMEASQLEQTVNVSILNGSSITAESLHHMPKLFTVCCIQSYSSVESCAPIQVKDLICKSCCSDTQVDPSIFECRVCHFVA
jgi:hypothetical protein